MSESSGNVQMELAESATVAERESLDVMPGLLGAANEGFVAALEKTAENAGRVVNAMNKTLVAIALPGDWVTHDGNIASLCSAGAERFLKFFPMKFTDWEREKQEWSDVEGKAYRWIYRAICTFGGTVLMTEGRFSTRDKLLGFKDDKWRPLEEIDESDIMAAARHICIGEGIKAHLGLRAMPIEELDKLKVNVKNIKSFGGYQSGSRGGAPTASADDYAIQTKLRKMCIEIANGDMDSAASILEDESSFTGKDGTKVAGKKNTTHLTGQRLSITYDKVKGRYIATFGQEQYNADIEGGGNGK